MGAADGHPWGRPDAPPPSLDTPTPPPCPPTGPHPPFTAAATSAGLRRSPTTYVSPCAAGPSRMSNTVTFFWRAGGEGAWRGCKAGHLRRGLGPRRCPRGVQAHACVRACSATAPPARLPPHLVAPAVQQLLHQVAAQEARAAGDHGTALGRPSGHHVRRCCCRCSLAAAPLPPLLPAAGTGAARLLPAVRPSLPLPAYQAGLPRWPEGHASGLQRWTTAAAAARPLTVPLPARRAPCSAE